MMEKINKKITKKAISKIKEALNIESDYALAKKLEVTASVIGRYNNGHNSITVDKLDDYAEKLGLNMEISFNKK